MCGIVGILAIGADGHVDRRVLIRMRDTMIHRGPDGGEVWVAENGQVGFGHRRLSIVDLSPSASQPMFSEDGGVVITCNGEIYNHAALRSRLAARHRFRTGHSDTEVLVHGYEEWGLDGLLARVEGDYGFAIWDQRARVLSLARDRIGVKPLYFTVAAGHLLFASEMKALVAHPDVGRDIDPYAMYHYLSFLAAPAPLTMMRGIYKLPAGCRLTVDAAGSMRMARYWDAVPGRGIEPAAVAGLSDSAREEFYVTGIRDRLRASVAKRMMADVPLGVLLSGGVDSSANLAVMSEHAAHRVDTFTVGFGDHPELNELEQARAIGKRFNTNHHEIVIRQPDMIASLDRIIYHQDEPIADWVCIPLLFVAKLAHERGMKVVHVGEGSDEQFCGYSSYMSYLRLYHRHWQPFRRFLPRSLQRLAAAAAKRASRFPPLALYVDIADRAARGREYFWSGATAFWETMKERLVNAPALGPPGDHGWALAAGVLDPDWLVADSYAVVRGFLAPFDRDHPGRDALTRMIHNEFRLRLPELLLMRLDKIGMAESLEARVPFLDHELVEFTMDIPEAWKTRGGEPKYLLKRAVEHLLPRDVISREKVGFGAPMAEWLRGDFGGAAQSAVLGSGLMRRGLFDLDYIRRLFDRHRSGRADCSLHLWTLYNLTAWYDAWIERREGGVCLRGAA